MDIAHVDLLAAEINNIVSKIKTLIPNLIAGDIKNMFDSFDANASPLRDAIISNNKDNISHFGISLSSFGESIGNYTAGLTDSVPTTISDNLIAKSNSLQSYLLQANPMFRGAVSHNIETMHFLSETKDKLKTIVDEQERNDQRIKKLLSESEARVASLEQKIKDLQLDAYGEIDKIKSVYLATHSELEIKKSEIDKILGHVSGRAVAGDYEKSASEEKRMADLLRWGSLGCMAFIAFALGFSLFETIGAGFDWQKSVFRVVLGFLLSVPAAYLARESAKHREQQYQHQQTSLDLKAISPFMASLPDEEQHKIKIEIATKLFAGRDFSKVSADPFPLNTQEIIIELIKKLEIPKTDSKTNRNAGAETKP
ncbi:hypothetical protein D3C84_381220 [compost metagenome]